MDTKKKTHFEITNAIKEGTVRTISNSLNVSAANGEKKFMIYQYFLPKTKDRLEEMQYCLKKNFQNQNIDKIYLLNERIYTRDELGLRQWKQEIIDKRIKQVNINSRLKFNDVYDFVEKQKLMGFIITINSDIFFDDSINVLNKTDLHLHRSLLTLIRYEYRKYIVDLQDCRLFGNRGDSQDTWIFHSDYNIKKCFRKAFNFYFGQPGCDNKLLYLYKTLGYELYNDPEKVRSYHYHSEDSRNYNLPVLNAPHLNIMPYKKEGYGNGLNNIYGNTIRFNMKRDNSFLNEYIKNKIAKGEHFVIPRIAGIENQVALMGYNLIKNKGEMHSSTVNYLKNAIKTMKNNAGIKLSDLNSVIKYSQLYLQPFDKCDLYTDWETYGNVYKGIHISHDFITKTFAVSKKPVWARTLDIFEYIHADPWTLQLTGKKILIISSFVKTIEKNMKDASKIYNIDLFPNCSFVYLKPPQTNGTNESRDFKVELDEFCKEINKIKDSFDVALVSCGGYGNLVCNHIFDIGKSAIYVGGVLQMYFGILGNRWVQERPDILRLYLNEKWHRPEAEERPKGFEKIENSCYW